MAIYDPTNKKAITYDTHTHLNDDQLFSDPAAYIARAAEYSVDYMNIVGYDLIGNQRAIEIAEQYQDKNVRAIIGWQPDSVADFDFDYLKDKLNNPVVVGVGETGLDYFHEGFDKTKQINAFEQHLQLAQELSLPVTIHNRKATEDVLSIIKNYSKIEIIMHSFAYGPDIAEKFLSLNENIFLSFSGMVTFKNAKEVHNTAKITPLNRMLIETDAPYLTPSPFRGKRINEPMLVSYVADGLAYILEMSRDAVADTTTKTAKSLWWK